MAIKYKQIALEIKESIEHHDYSTEKLPTEAALMKQYKVSRQTIREALAALEKEGLVRRVQGSGTFLTGLSSSLAKNLIAVFLPSLQEYIYPALIQDLRLQFEARGFSIQAYETLNNPAIERELLSELLKNPPGGLLLEGCKSALPSPNLDLLEALEEKGCPLVFLFNRYTSMDTTYVMDDNVQGSGLLIRHLTSLGHTAIAGIFQADDLQGLERYQGFMEGLRDVGLPLPSEQICWYRTEDAAHLLFPSSSQSFDDYLMEHIKGCTAVVCYNDLLAHHLAKFLHRQGYQIPEEIAITSFDNSYLSYSDELYLTSLYHKQKEISSLACQAMLQRIIGLKVPSYRVPWKLLIQESTMPDA